LEKPSKERIFGILNERSLLAALVERLRSLNWYRISTQPESIIMHDLPLSVIVPGLLGAGAFVVSIWRAFFSGLASVPGPLLARFTDLWYTFRIYCGHFEKDSLELHKKHGAFCYDYPSL